ncbi:MAG: tetratricopeptide repeat protein [Pirellulaceae bacterium]
MKTDRRHELQTNVLADWIGKHIEQSQGYAKTVLAVILLVAAAAIAGVFLTKDQAARSQASWSQFFQAFGERDPEALEVVASAHQGTTAGLWARLAQADLKLSEGIGDLYTNRDNAKKNLAEAERNYLTVAQAAKEKLLRERAWFGLGQVYESLAEVEKAKEFYGKLVSSSPTSALAKEAQQRTDALSDPSIAKWYNWFANQTPRPPAIPGGPGDGLGLPNLPSDLGDLSDRPDLSLPGLPPVTPDSEATPLATDAPESGPELNSPAPASAPAPTEDDAATPDEPAATRPEKAESPAASESPAEPAPSEPSPSEPAPEPSETPAEDSSTAGEDAPE